MNIKSWALEDRPREKLFQWGPKQLTTAELLAIVLGNGTRDISAVQLAKSILSAADNNLEKLSSLSINQLKEIKGVGPAKAVTIKAVLELANRKLSSESSEREQVTSSNEAFNILAPNFADLETEEFWVIYLNRANKVITKSRISLGGVSALIVDPKVIFREALSLLASSIVIAHNHPSGNLKPSQQDINITKKIFAAAQNLDINLLDHIILAGGSFFSFADNGMIG